MFRTVSFLIVHGGFPKSGSTTIQKSIEKFISNRDTVVFKSSTFHKSNPTQASSHIRLLFDSERPPRGEVATPANKDTAMKDLEDFKSNVAQNKILSGEGFSNLERQDFDSAVDFLDPSRVEVRLVIRNPWDYQSAKFQHHLKVGISELTVNPLDYSKRVETFASYPTELFSFEDLVRSSSFVQTVLPEVGVGDVDPQNQGLTQPGLAFLWRCHLVEKHLNLDLSQGDRMVLRRVAKELPGKKFRLHPEDCNVLPSQFPDYGFDWQEPDRPEEDFWYLTDFLRPMNSEFSSMISQVPSKLPGVLSRLSPSGKENFNLVNRFATSEIDSSYDISHWLDERSKFFEFSPKLSFRRGLLRNRGRN